MVLNSRKDNRNNNAQEQWDALECRLRELEHKCSCCTRKRTDEEEEEEEEEARRRSKWWWWEEELGLGEHVATRNQATLDHEAFQNATVWSNQWGKHRAMSRREADGRGRERERESNREPRPRVQQ